MKEVIEAPSGDQPFWTSQPMRSIGCVVPCNHVAGIDAVKPKFPAPKITPSVFVEIASPLGPPSVVVITRADALTFRDRLTEILLRE